MKYKSPENPEQHNPDYYNYHYLEFEGSFRDSYNKYNGTLIFNNGDIFQGYFDVVGEISSTFGIIEYNDGKRFKGSLKLDTLDTLGDCKLFYLPDTGTLVYNNTEGDYLFYNGSFKHGKKHGFGKMFFKHGGVYDGQWENDLPFHAGEYNFKDWDETMTFNGQTKQEIINQGREPVPGFEHLPDFDLDVMQPQNRALGRAGEVHSAFENFISIQTEYLRLIDQPDIQSPDIYEFIRDTFTRNITELFPNDNDKLENFNTVFRKVQGFILEQHKLLIEKSIRFAFSQGDDFKREYIKTFLDETCNAYAGSVDPTSCTVGIRERFVLSVGSAVEILCSNKCENETYQKLDKLMNPKFDINVAAQEWFAMSEPETSIQHTMDIEGRKADFITYLRNKAEELGSFPGTDEEIIRYTESINYSFANLQLGGKKTKKLRKTKKSKKLMKTKKSKKSI